MMRAMDDDPFALAIADLIAAEEALGRASLSIMRYMVDNGPSLALDNDEPDVQRHILNLYQQAMVLRGNLQRWYSARKVTFP